MLNLSFLKLNKLGIGFSLLSVAFYIAFAYDLVRADYVKLISLYAGLFFLFYTLVNYFKSNLRFLLLLAGLFRLIFIFAMPNLSQDFYRFIWDGRMILQGMNPYLFTPESFIKMSTFPIAQAQKLYDGMGFLNGSHYTNYPPVKQLIFAIAALISGKSILGSAIVFRVFIIAADFGTFYYGKKLLEKFQMPVHSIFWYLLNPFIIIELTGSLHFEGIMIFLMIYSFYLIHSGKWKFAAFLFALSISVKLIPFMFLPLFYHYFQNRSLNSDRAFGYGIINLLLFYGIVGITTLLLFAPFYSSEFVNHYSDTVALWFGQFEFNASLYYIARSIGYWISGYNQIALIGKFIPLIVTIVLVAFTFLRKNDTMPKLLVSMLLMATIYYFTSTTIHPWYLATLVALSIFTNYKFPLVWSFMIVLSYYAYSNTNASENLWVIALEYVVVYAVFIWEVFLRRPISSQKSPLNS